jgi:hypothetical protein
MIDPLVAIGLMLCSGMLAGIISIEWHLWKKKRRLKSEPQQGATKWQA